MEASLRVLHLAGEYPPRRLGGIATYLENLVTEQRKRHEVGVAVLEGDDYHQDGPAGDARVTFVSFDASALASGPMLDPLALARAIPARGVLAERWDVLHVHDWYGVLPALGARGAVMVMTAHLPLRFGFTYANHPVPVRDKSRLEAMGFRLSRRVVTPSAHVAALLEREYDVPRAKLRVVPNGVDAAHFVPGKAARARVPTVLSVGRLSEQKGIDLLIDAFARMRSRVPEAVLEIVGEGPARSALEAHARRLGLDGSVRFLGYVAHAELPACFARAHVFASTSVYEPFGLTTVEAMACGLPAIVSPLGGGPEIVRDEQEGLVRWPQHAGTLADALARLLEDEALRARMGEAACARARELSWRATAEQLDAVYHEAREGRRA